MQADSNVVSTLINEQQITELATNGRNVVALAALGLGVSGNLPDSNAPTSVGANYTISFNGLNQAHNIWIIDGGEAYDRGSGGKMSMMPSQDALGEFQVLASNYPPDYGISSGGTVTMSIKSGTQKFHGEAWEFDRNDALDAHNYFDNNTGQQGRSRNCGITSTAATSAARCSSLTSTTRPGRRPSSSSTKSGARKSRAVRLRRSTPFLRPISSLRPRRSTYVLPAFNNSMQLAAGVGNQIFVPITADPAFNAKLTAAGLTPGTPFPNNTIPGIAAGCQRPALQHAEEYSRRDQSRRPIS